MGIPWGFDGEHGTDVRPPHVAATKAWAKNESQPGANDGTRVTAALVNRVVGNVRALADAAGSPLTESSDEDILHAVVALIGATAPAPHMHDTRYYQKAETDALLDVKVPISAIVDNLASTSALVPLSAAQGKVLKDLIDGLGDITPVADLAEAATLTGLDRGDLVHVGDNGAGKWARYQVLGAGDGTWAGCTKVLLWTQDQAPATHGHVAGDITDSTSDSRAIITGANFAAIRTLLGLSPPCANRAALAAIDTAKITGAYLCEAGREGTFAWRTGDYSAQIAADTAEGLYIKADSVAATAGAWVRIFDGPVLSSWFGVSAGAADNSASLSAWLKMLCEFNLYGHHNVAANVQAAVTCAPVNTDVAIMITAERRARITYTGAGGLRTLVALNVDGIKDVTVSGLRIDGGDKCATGLRIEPLSGAPDTIIVRDCVVKNLRLVTGGSANGQGIRIGAPNATPGRYAEVSGCHVKGLYKDSGVTLANSGISIVNFDNTRCDHNTVEEIHHDGTNLLDADGIAIFAGNVSLVYGHQTVSCQFNVLRNCAGRCIKLQTNGNALVHGNSCHLIGAIPLIAEWRWIDSQVGNCELRSNELYADASWTGGGNATLISLQTPSTISADNERVTQVARNNRVWTKKRFETFFRPIVRDVAVDITWDVSGNQIYGPQALADTTGANMGVNFSVVWTMVALTAGGRYRLTFNNNSLQSNTFLALAGAVSGDHWASVTIEACDNTMHPLSVAAPIISSSSTWYTSAMKLAGNNVGGQAGARVDPPIDLQYVLPGSEFYLGSGAYLSAPSNKTFRAFKKETRLHMQLATDAVIQRTADNGATWKQVTLS